MKQVLAILGTLSLAWLSVGLLALPTLTQTLPPQDSSLVLPTVIWPPAFVGLLALAYLRSKRDRPSHSVRTAEIPVHRSEAHSSLDAAVDVSRTRRRERRSKALKAAGDAGDILLMLSLLDDKNKR